MSSASIITLAQKNFLPSLARQKEVSRSLTPFIDRINSSLKDAKAILGGSGAKGTWLESFDVDIFVLFDYRKYSNRSADISDIAEKHLRKKFKKIERLHGSRDYFRIEEKGIIFEVIPILEIKKASEAKNITDISPLHTKWVLKNKKFADQIRLTKLFMKSNNLYGAESYIRGFSGYVCEILTIHYGSFLGLLKAAKKWKSGDVIDVNSYYKSKNVFLEMNKSKLVSPLIVIDPVQHDRNAAAALSSEKFSHFILLATEFLSSPTLHYFEPKALDRADVLKKSKGKKAVLVFLKPLFGKEDIVGAKIMKAYEFLVQKIKKEGFTLHHSDWSWNLRDDAALLFVMDKKDLSEKVELRGPPLFAALHVEKFKKMHKVTFVKKKIIFATEKREFRKAEDLIRALLCDEYVKERSAGSRIEVL